jgi:hypothetical protein
MAPLSESAERDVKKIVRRIERVESLLEQTLASRFVPKRRRHRARRGHSQR